MLLVCMLLEYIRNCLKSILRYKFLILDAYHRDNLDLREQGCEDPWLFVGAKRGSRAKNVSETPF
jgi:hypothetical protein